MPDKLSHVRACVSDRRTTSFLGGALVSLALGYWLLSKGSTTLAPVLLVLGYCVLFPVGLAL